LLRDLQLDLADLATLTGVQPNTVYRWLRPPDAHQALAVPVYVATILRLLRTTPSPLCPQIVSRGR